MATMKLNSLKYSLIITIIVLLSLHVGALVLKVDAVNPFNMAYHYDNQVVYADDDLQLNNEKRSSRNHIYRRGCIRRSGVCDHRPNDCCFNSSCRCNLWGTNCRCQRMGLFQKWG